MASDFISTQFPRLLDLPQDAPPGEWCRIYSEATQAGMAEEWPATHSEDFCRGALQTVGWLMLDRLPADMAAWLDDMDEAGRATIRAAAEFVMANMPGILPRPDRQDAWRALIAERDGFPQAGDAPLFAILAQAILIERHLRPTVH